MPARQVRHAIWVIHWRVAMSFTASSQRGRSSYDYEYDGEGSAVELDARQLEP